MLIGKGKKRIKGWALPESSTPLSRDFDEVVTGRFGGRKVQGVSPRDTKSNAEQGRAAQSWLRGAGAEAPVEVLTVE